MSYTFSRRDFMKYTALTAVAIAGSGMLTGCSNPNRPTGTVGSKLSPGDRICDATLKSATYTGNTLTCNFDIYTKVLRIQKPALKSIVTDWTEVISNLSKKILIQSCIVRCSLECLNHNFCCRLRCSKCEW